MNPNGKRNEFNTAWVPDARQVTRPQTHSATSPEHRPVEESMSIPFFMNPETTQDIQPGTQSERDTMQAAAYTTNRGPNHGAVTGISHVVTRGTVPNSARGTNYGTTNTSNHVAIQATTHGTTNGTNAGTTTGTNMPNTVSTQGTGRLVSPGTTPGSMRETNVGNNAMDRNGQSLSVSSSIMKQSMLHHPCPFEGCKRVFLKRYRMCEHLRVHTDERPYHCVEPFCGKAFRWRSSWVSHRASHARRRRRQREQEERRQLREQVEQIEHMEMMEEINRMNAQNRGGNVTWEVGSSSAAGASGAGIVHNQEIGNARLAGDAGHVGNMETNQVAETTRATQEMTVAAVEPAGGSNLAASGEAVGYYQAPNQVTQFSGVNTYPQAVYTLPSGQIVSVPVQAGMDSQVEPITYPATLHIETNEVQYDQNPKPPM